MDSSRTRRILGLPASVAATLLALTACFALPSASIDTDAIANAVTATSDSIESTTVDTSVDGLTTELYVRPVLASGVITTGGLMGNELDAVLRVAFTMSQGKVATIEVRTVDANDNPVDLEAAASELGIHYLPHTNSISYSTTVLAEEYGS